MAFNNVPVNGWPQIKKLEELDAIAKKIDNMPTFSSTDRDWLDEWENKLPELPADPETNGVKVLTATTESGETVKSWEEPESGTWNYSTDEVNTGQKWIDGKDIYAKTFSSSSSFTIGIDWTATGLEIADAECIVDAKFVRYESHGLVSCDYNLNSGVVRVNRSASLSSSTGYAVTAFYTKTDVQQTRKRGK